MKKVSARIILTLCTLLFTASIFAGTTYFIDSREGNDKASGQQESLAWKSLDRLNSVKLEPGDIVLLKCGSIFSGQRIILENIRGSEAKPIMIGSYGGGDLPILDLENKAEYGITIKGGSHLIIENLVMQHGKGGVELLRTEEAGRYTGFTFRNLTINYMMVENAYAFLLNQISRGEKKSCIYSDILIENCHSDMINRSFIMADALENLVIRNNVFTHCGGPGMRIGQTNTLHIVGNIIDSSGSRVSPTFKGRGSCGWLIFCKDAMVEYNKFYNAQGWLDSYGFHVDIGNQNVIIQYNVSMNNSGGFVQILGKNQHVAYRYNISINDGYREQGDFDGRFKVIQSGFVISLNGFVAEKAGGFAGPFNSYIYNNTIFMGEHMNTGFNVRYTVEGALIANNIFYFKNPAENGTGNKKDREPENTVAKNVIFSNNLFLDPTNFPTDLMADANNNFFGDPGFYLPGGTSPENYLPLKPEMVKDKGIVPYTLPGDDQGLSVGMEVEHDFFGNAIEGLPDIGAIELVELESFKVKNSDTHD